MTLIYYTVGLQLATAGLKPSEILQKGNCSFNNYCWQCSLLLGLWISHCLRGKKHFFVGEVK